MEAFESFVALDLEAEGFVVSPAVKFPVRRQTAKAAYPEFQTHGYEVDLVGARADMLVLATVRSFFGSRGVTAESVRGEPDERSGKGYALLNDQAIRDGVIGRACERYGYRPEAVELRLCVGKFAGSGKGSHESDVRAWCAHQNVGAGPIKVHSVTDVVDRVVREAGSSQYRNNPVLVTVKVLQAAGLLLDVPASALT